MFYEIIGSGAQISFSSAGNLSVNDEECEGSSGEGGEDQGGVEALVLADAGTVAGHHADRRVSSAVAHPQAGHSRSAGPVASTESSIVGVVVVGVLTEPSVGCSAQVGVTSTCTSIVSIVIVIGEGSRI